MKLKTKKSKIYFCLVIAAALMIIASAMYLTNSYPADEAVVSAIYQKTGLEYSQPRPGVLAFIPENYNAGLIFYPGGKVEHRAYIPLMEACARNNILCVLVEMPFDLAVFDSKAAAGVQEMFPEVEFWYIGGHSLGGSMAAYYLDEHASDYNGLVLLASYSTKDLSDTGLKVLSVYGSEDGVLNMENYSANIINLPSDFEEFIIDGGNHAGFGVYGPQKNDGEATITNDEQIEIAAQTIAEFIK